MQVGKQIVGPNVMDLVSQSCVLAHLILSHHTLGKDEKIVQENTMGPASFKACLASFSTDSPPPQENR